MHIENYNKVKVSTSNIQLRKNVINKYIAKNLNVITPGFTGNCFDTPLWTKVLPIDYYYTEPYEIRPQVLSDRWKTAFFMLINKFSILIKAKTYL